MINPEMIRMARDARAVTQAKLCTALDLTQGALSKIETGLLPFPNDRIEKLCQALRYPQTFFAQSWLYESAPARLYRRRKSVAQGALAQRAAQMNIMKHQLAALLRSVEPIQRRFPCYEPESFRGGAAAVAVKVREEMRLPPGPIGNLTQLLERSGVVIVPFHFGMRQIDACADWIDGQPVIFLADHLCSSRQRFTLAHEFAHLVMHQRWEDTSDAQADSFAGEFLLPKAEIKSQLLPMTLKRYMQLKCYWRVSIAALLKQADLIGVGSGYQRRQMWQLLSARGYRLAEPGEDLLPREESETLRNLVALHKRDLGYSDDQLGQLLCVLPDELGQSFSDKRTIVKFQAQAELH
jgi:Zn-dependent peptidase ImmA (M78 family)/transcriptional regulator with XRE-family HTH domain